MPWVKPRSISMLKCIKLTIIKWINDVKKGQSKQRDTIVPISISKSKLKSTKII